MFKTWFQTFKTALTQPKEYKNLSQRSFWSGYWYLFLLVLIGIFLKTLVFASGMVVAVPFVKSQLPMVKNQIRTAFPQDLVVKVENGTASTNVQEPYVITLHQLIPQLKNEKNVNLITIDTQAQVEQYQSYKTGFLLTKMNLVYPSRNNSSSNAYEVLPLSNIKEPITIDKTTYGLVIAQVLPFVDKVPQIMYGLAAISVILFPLFGAFFFVNGSLFYLLVMALVLLVIAKIMKRDLSYRVMYKASMFGLTFPLVVTYVAELLRVQISGLYNLAFLGWMICVLTLYPKSIYTQINAKPKKVPSRKTLSTRNRRA
ncbi:MAG: DUF1189 family protein [Microgenomates group bacterium]